MRTALRVMLATISIITGYLAIRMGRQFDRSMRTAFTLSDEDLP